MGFSAGCMVASTFVGNALGAGEATFRQVKTGRELKLFWHSWLLCYIMTFPCKTHHLPSPALATSLAIATFVRPTLLAKLMVLLSYIHSVCYTSSGCVCRGRSSGQDLSRGCHCHSTRYLVDSGNCISRAPCSASPDAPVHRRH
jgi:hypothetical protein